METSQNNVLQGGPEQDPGRSAQRPENPHPADRARGTLNIGGIIGRTFETLLKNPAVFFGLAFAAMLPPAFLGTFIPQGSPLTLAVKLVEIILGFIVQGSIAYAVYQVMKGNPVSIGNAVSRGAAVLVPLILTSILVSLGMALGMVLLVIPGLILMCMWFVAIPVCVVERTGPLASLRRSSSLTRGFRWQIFGLLLLTFVLIIALVGAGTFLAMAVTSNYALATLAGTIIGVLPQAFSSVLYAIVYHDLRVIKEGVSLESLTSIFD